MPFRTLDADFDQVGVDMVSDGDNLYIVKTTSLIGYQRGKIEVFKWNGLFWTNLPPIITDDFQYGPNNKMKMAIHNGNLTLGGSFKNGNGYLKGLIKWENGNWQNVNGGISSNYRIHDEISIDQVLSFEGQLWVGGNFNLVNNQNARHLAILTNNNWTLPFSDANHIKDLIVLNDSIYATGDFNFIENTQSPNLAAYANGTWHSVIHPFGNNLEKLFQFNNQLIAYLNNSIWIRNYQQWNALDLSNFSKFEVQKGTTHNGKLYLTGSFIFNGENAVVVSWNGVSWSTVLLKNNLEPKVSENYLISSAKSQLLIAGDIDSYLGMKMGKFIELQPGKSMIRGRVFQDIDKNCSFDLFDEAVPNEILSVNDGQYYTSTDENGYYDVFVEKNSTTTIQFFPEKNEKLECDFDLRYVEFFDKDSIAEINFALEIIPEAPRLKPVLTSAGGFSAKHGYENAYTISFDPINQELFPLSITLKLDPRLIDITSDIPEDILKSDLVKWTIKSNSDIHFTCTPDPYQTQANDNLDFDLTIASAKYTGLLSGNTSLHQQIVAAFDPNDKQCDKLEIYGNDRDLNYHIRFQNLGTDSARNIFVVDTIDNNIPLQYLKILDASNFDKYKASFKVRDHAIIWSFKDIELPSKIQSSDEESSGFISFRTALSDELTVGDSILNTAYIYFDFQEPVVTNTVVSKRVEKLDTSFNQSNEITTYPNPSSGFINVHSPLFSINKLELISLDGKLLDMVAFSEPLYDYQWKLDSSLNGLFLLRIAYSNGITVKKIVLQN